MGPIATHVRGCVCLCCGHTSELIKTTEPIKMAFAGNCVRQSLPREGALLTGGTPCVSPSSPTIPQQLHVYMCTYGLEPSIPWPLFCLHCRNVEIKSPATAFLVNRECCIRSWIRYTWVRCLRLHVTQRTTAVIAVRFLPAALATNRSAPAVTLHQPAASR